MELLILMVGMFAVMWLLLIRPQRRRQAEQARMLGALGVGDEIVTAGGIYGTIEAVEEDELRVAIAPGTSVRVARRAVATVVETEEDETEADAEAEEELEPGARAEPEPGARAEPEEGSQGALPR